MDPPLRISTPKPKKENDEYSEEDYDTYHDYKSEYTSMSKSETNLDSIMHTNPASQISPLELNPKDHKNPNDPKCSKDTISNIDNNQSISIKPSSTCCRPCECIRQCFNTLCYKFYIFCLELD